jgi:putrescine transport system substrate-binding protein
MFHRLCIFFWILFFISGLGAENAEASLGKKIHTVEEKKVFVYGWAEYVPKSVLDAFSKETGIEVVYDAFDSIDTLETKLLITSGYDLVFPPAWPLLCMGIKKDLFLPLKKEWIPNAQGCEASILNNLSTIDPKNTYGMPYLWGTTGLGYDEEAIKALAPDAPLKSWALVFDPYWAKRLSSLRIILLDSVTDVLQAALLYLHESPTTLDPAKWDKAIEVVMKVRPYITNFEGSRQAENLLEGQSALLQGFSTYISKACASAKIQTPPKKICYTIPKEGAVVWVDVMTIPKNAPHPRNAHRLIDFLLRPKIMAEISNTLRASNAIPASRAWIHKNITEDPSLFPNAESMKRLHADFAPPFWLARYLSRHWLKIKMGYRP